MEVELLPIIKLINDTITDKGFISQENVVKLHYNDIQEIMEQYANQRVIEELEDIIEDLNLLIMQNEDDFDRGRGKYILWKEIERLKREVSCSLSNESDNNKQ